MFVMREAGGAGDSDDVDSRNRCEVSYMYIINENILWFDSERIGDGEGICI